MAFILPLALFIGFSVLLSIFASQGPNRDLFFLCQVFLDKDHVGVLDHYNDELLIVKNVYNTVNA